MKVSCSIYALCGDYFAKVNVLPTDMVNTQVDATLMKGRQTKAIYNTHNIKCFGP